MGKYRFKGPKRADDYTEGIVVGYDEFGVAETVGVGGVVELSKAKAEELGELYELEPVDDDDKDDDKNESSSPSSGSSGGKGH